MKRIFTNYKKVLEAGNGARFIKVDLHVHTPASGDAQAKNKYNFKYDIGDIPGSREMAKKIAGEIVEGALKKGLGLIAITDHNTPSNTHPEDLTNTWYEMIRQRAAGTGLCVLPGIEISTDDLHILVILEHREGEPAAYNTHRINFLLQDCRFTLEEYGDYKATGMASLFDVLEHIESLGAACIAIPAHIDGGKKALLSVYRKPGNIYNKILNHPQLNAVEVVKESTAITGKIGGKSGEVIKDYFNRIRNEDRSPLAFVQDSDGHAVDEIGRRFTYIRMGEAGFWPLKGALEDPETRVRMACDYRQDHGKTRITGAAFRRGKGGWVYTGFNENLNCIIGRKGTGKSMIIDAILYALKRFDLKEGEEVTAAEQNIIDRKYTVDLFIGKGSEIYCYSRSGKSDPKIFRLDGTSFVPYEGVPALEFPRKYDHKVIEKLFTGGAQLIDFLDRHIFAGDKAKDLLAERNDLLEKARKAGFTGCEKEIAALRKVCGKIFLERARIMDKSLKKYGGDIFRVKVTRGKWEKGDGENDFFDRADLSVRSGSRYKRINGLSTGERNAVMMVLLMNEDAFGPLIIDDPEQYLDVASIVSILVPRMRKLKTSQQIICATKDEHILLSGDSEQVIVTLSEDKIEVITGDITSPAIQEQVLEIFEGGREALNDKNRRVCQMLG